jgi:hypothetical protein
VYLAAHVLEVAAVDALAVAVVFRSRIRVQELFDGSLFVGLMVELDPAQPLGHLVGDDAEGLRRRQAVPCEPLKLKGPLLVAQPFPPAVFRLRL